MVLERTEQPSFWILLDWNGAADLDRRILVRDTTDRGGPLTARR
jgi:hypothetical protein